MIKARPYQVDPAVLWHKISTSYRFFASRRNYGYALLQETQYLVTNLAPKNSARAT